MRKQKIVYILILTITALFIYSANAKNLPKWFPFNRKDALEEWEEKIFKGRVLYTVELGQEGGYLSAKSESTCSGLLYKISFNPEKLPMISWEWMVMKFPEKTKVSEVPPDDKNKGKNKGWIEQDDYAARVYVIFPSSNFKKTKSIEYIWDEDLPEGTILTSPYFKNIKLIVVKSGKNIGQWMFEERNIYEDYKKAFGKAPTAWVGAIALMTDTDNTVSTAEALYKNIKVGYKDESKE